MSTQGQKADLSGVLVRTPVRPQHEAGKLRQIDRRAITSDFRK